MIFSILALLAGSVAAEVSVNLSARSFQPGEVVLVTVQGTASIPRGGFDQVPLEFFRASSSTCLALLGLDLDISTGVHRLELEAYDPAGVRALWGSDVVVS